MELRRRLEANDAFVIVSPEYNSSMPGVLKNAIDWTSRHKPQPFNGRHALLLSASPSIVGGNRGLWALRIPLEHLGARVYPDMFSLAQAHEAFKPTAGSSVRSWRADSKRLWSGSWISSRPRSTIPASRRRGSNSSVRGRIP